MRETEGGIAGEVYSRLRADIVGGRRHPGERLKSVDLAATYGASVGALREALTRLEAERLVQSQRNLGYRVVPLSHRDLADLTIARITIESVVLRMSIEGGDLNWESDIVAAHHNLSRTPFLIETSPDRINPDWAAAHDLFHRRLLAACPNARLLQTATAMREEYELYRQWSVTLGREPNRDVAQEHRDLMDAALARDSKRAVGLLRDHIAHTGQLVISVASDDPNTDILSLLDPPPLSPRDK